MKKKKDTNTTKSLTILQILLVPIYIMLCMELFYEASGDEKTLSVILGVCFILMEALLGYANGVIGTLKYYRKVELELECNSSPYDAETNEPEPNPEASESETDNAYLLELVNGDTNEPKPNSEASEPKPNSEASEPESELNLEPEPTGAQKEVDSIVGLLASIMDEGTDGI